MNDEEIKSTMKPEELVQVYEEELKRKDELIEKLKEENLLLMRTALHNSEKRAQSNQRFKEIHEHLTNQTKRKETRESEQETSNQSRERLSEDDKQQESVSKTQSNETK